MKRAIPVAIAAKASKKPRIFATASVVLHPSTIDAVKVSVTATPVSAPVITKKKIPGGVRAGVTSKDRLACAKKLLQLDLPEGSLQMSVLERIAREDTGASASTARRWLNTLKHASKIGMCEQQIMLLLNGRGRRHLVSLEGTLKIKEKIDSGFLSRTEIEALTLRVANQEASLFKRPLLKSIPKTSMWRFVKRLRELGCVIPKIPKKKKKQILPKSKSNSPVKSFHHSAFKLTANKTIPVSAIAAIPIYAKEVDINSPLSTKESR